MPTARNRVVRGLDFTLADGQIGCLLGPSGCGKTTVLRCLAGFEPVAGGAIALSRPRRLRAGPPDAAGSSGGIGMVFQDYALFPHLTVAGNVGFGFGRRPSPAARARVAEMLALVGLAGVGRRLSARALRRPAAARRAGPRARARARPAAARRAVLQPRHRPARAAVARGARHHQGQRHDGDPGDARPARGVRARRRDRHHARRPRSSSGTARTTSTTSRRRASSPISSGRACSCAASSPGRARSSPSWASSTRCCPRRVVEGGAVDVLLRPDDIVHDDASPWHAEVAKKAFRGADFLYTLTLASGTQRAVAGAVAPRSRARREDRHPPRDRPRRRVSRRRFDLPAGGAENTPLVAPASRAASPGGSHASLVRLRGGCRRLVSPSRRAAVRAQALGEAEAHDRRRRQAAVLLPAADHRRAAGLLQGRRPRRRDPRLSRRRARAAGAARRQRRRRVRRLRAHDHAAGEGPEHRGAGAAGQVRGHRARR